MTHTNFKAYAHLLSTLALTALLSACSADEPTVILNNSNTAGSGGTGAVASAGAGGSGGGSGASAEPACVEEPAAPEEFLVRCTQSTCRPFDNADRLGLYQAGQALPEVP